MPDNSDIRVSIPTKDGKAWWYWDGQTWTRMSSPPPGFGTETVPVTFSADDGPSHQVQIGQARLRRPD